MAEGSGIHNIGSSVKHLELLSFFVENSRHSQPQRAATTKHQPLRMHQCLCQDLIETPPLLQPGNVPDYERLWHHTTVTTTARFGQLSYVTCINVSSILKLSVYVRQQHKLLLWCAAFTPHPAMIVQSPHATLSVGALWPC